MPGSLSAAGDSAKETATIVLFLWLLFHFVDLSFGEQLILFLSFGLGWLIWKTGRSALLGWNRLERLHRVIEQEKYEIENNRPQEREELGVLYKAKGFQGKLLEDVLDVLMADQDRLLKVMLEEELGLTLAAYEHPLKQCLGAALGVLSVLSLSILFFYLFPQYGMPLASFCSIGISTVIAATYEKNAKLASLIWNLSIAGAGFGAIIFVYEFLKFL